MAETSSKLMANSSGGSSSIGLVIEPANDPYNSEVNYVTEALV